MWSERVVVALPEDHLLASRDIVHWSELRHEALLLPQRGPGPEFLKLLFGKVGHSDPCHLLRHDVGLDRLLTLVGAGWGILLALEGATGAAYPGVTYREVHDGCRRANSTRLPRLLAPSELQSFVATLSRYPPRALSGSLGCSRSGLSRVSSRRGERPIRRHEPVDHRRDQLGRIGHGPASGPTKDLGISD